MNLADHNDIVGLESVAAQQGWRFLAWD